MNKLQSTVFAGVGAALITLLWKPFPAAAVNVTLTADSFTQASAATKNKGAGKTIELKSPAGGPLDKRAWVKFDLSTLPSGMTGEDIAQATLVVFANKVSTAGALDIRRVSGVWTEAAITDSTAPPLGLVEESAVPVSSVNSYVTADVTALVKDWLDGVLANNGLALLPNTAIGLDARFDSKESKGTSHPPRLEITLLHDFGIPGTLNTRAGTFSLVSNTTGDYNAAFGYATLSFNTTGFSNTAVGIAALNDNISGNYNTGVGHGALADNTTGTGNAGLGASALSRNTTGSNNTGVGLDALAHSTTGLANTGVGCYSLTANTTGSSNTAVGESALLANTIGTGNTAVGREAMLLNLSGNENAAVGNDALASNTAGGNNTAMGRYALSGNTTGNSNIAVGWGAGSQLTTGDDNIMIGSSGVAGEASTIRIGDTQTAAYVAGIFGATSASGTAVFVNSSGQLGTMTSSRRFKQDITDMGDTSDVLLRLHPVTFRYKPEIDPEGIKQYGLIAEEVAEVAPGLVQYDEGGNVHTVRYQLLVPMLLNELQKLAAENKQLKADAAAFDARLDAIEDGVRAIRASDARNQAAQFLSAAHAGSRRY
jgi:hypothetical protein